MSDRAAFWPASPDWTRARIAAGGVTVTAAVGDRGVFLLSGPGKAIAAIAAPHLGPDRVLLPIAPDRALLVIGSSADLTEGWHPSGVAISDLSDAHLRLDIRGPGAGALLRQASPSLALNAAAEAGGAALGFAGITVVYQPQPDGARIHVDLPQATHIWHWLLAAIAQTENQP